MLLQVGPMVVSYASQSLCTLPPALGAKHGSCLSLGDDVAIPAAFGVAVRNEGGPHPAEVSVHRNLLRRAGVWSLRAHGSRWQGDVDALIPDRCRSILQHGGSLTDGERPYIRSDRTNRVGRCSMVSAQTRGIQQADPVFRGVPP